MRRGCESRGWWGVVLILAVGAASLLFGGRRPAAAAAPPRGRAVILVLIDGLRWQEVFTGAEEALISKDLGGVADVDGLRKQFWRPTPEARREVLMPWVWGTVAREGQLYGNRLKGSAMKVTNAFNVSYPGYSEMITGYADPTIKDNTKIPNPNVSVFEWLGGKLAFRDRVAVFGTWDTVGWIVNRERCGLPVFAGFDPVTPARPDSRQELLNRLKAEMARPWDHSPYDAITFHAAREYLREKSPRALWFTFGETDEFAHAKRYDHYLDAIRRTDAHLRDLWEELQSHREYRGRTTLIFSVDHGRGRGAEWTSHGARYAGAEQVWLGAIGPNVEALGERANVPEVTQSQIAATVAAAVGEDYRAAQPRAGAAIRLAPAGAAGS